MTQFGIAEADVTPVGEVVLAGSPQQRAVSGVHSRLLGRVALLGEDGDRVAVVCLDVEELLCETAGRVRAAVGAAATVEPERIVVACSHTHSGPVTIPDGDKEVNREYLELLVSRLADCARAAAAAMQPVELVAAAVDVPGWTFNRRPVYVGEHVANHGPAYGPEFLRLEGPADDQLQVLAARTADGTIVGGLVNFASHATLMGSGAVVSADYPGELCAELGRRLGAPFGFLLGAAGNLGPNDLAQPHDPALFGPEEVERIGRGLAAEAEAALADAHILAAGPIRAATRRLSIAQRRAGREEAMIARSYFEDGGMSPSELRERIYGHPYTFSPQMAELLGPGNEENRLFEEWFARDAIRMWEYQRTLDVGELIDELELTAIAIGDLALVGIPVELFTEFGLRIKAESPFAQTCVVSLANGWHGYVPTIEAFEHGGYEPRFAYHSRLVPEAGDAIVTAALELLHELAR